MDISSTDISIAVTVYQRLDFLHQALRSAVDQTVPVKVVLYDDGCSDQSALQSILAQFPGRVEHRRNSQTLGLFANMNRCIRDSDTPWLSILHDDDALAPDFVEKILAAAPQVDRVSLFFGGTCYITQEGEEFHRTRLDRPGEVRVMRAEEMALKNWFAFPGQLLHAPTAARIGGFPENALYTGDWDLWFRLSLEDGAVFVKHPFGIHRTHLGADRGTTAAAKTGRRAACTGMQVKKNLSRLRRQGLPVRYDRRAWLELYHPLYRDVLVYTWRMPRWLLRYNRRLLLLTPARGRVTRCLNLASRFFGTPALRLAGLARKSGVLKGHTPPPF